MKRKTKSGIKEHWTGLGRWQHFVRIREHLKGEGWAAEEAWNEADRLMLEGYEPPSDADPEEILPSTTPRSSPESSGGLSSGFAERDEFKAETASTADTVRWVASYLMVSDAEPKDAPSAESWAMLQWARRNNANEASFWSQMWRQLMPTKAALEAETRFSDDGKPIMDLIHRIQISGQTDG
tara:strand:- start:8360 stop:8905 length:546 start_codon:yes stop_codon:yes gene_type:complete